jgi:hypothetical protein
VLGSATTTATASARGAAVPGLNRPPQPRAPPGGPPPPQAPPGGPPPPRPPPPRAPPGAPRE